MTQKSLNRKRFLIIISCICIWIIVAVIFAVMFVKSNNTMQEAKVQSVIGAEENLMTQNNIWEWEKIFYSKIEEAIMRKNWTEEKQDLSMKKESIRSEVINSFSGEEVSRESIYMWSAVGSEETEDYAYYDNRDEGYDANKVDEFITNYLLAQGINKTAPDGVCYDSNGMLMVEYYIDEQKQQYCFVLHLWTAYGDAVNGISKYEESVWCTTHSLTEEDKIGELICERDIEQDITHEQLLDVLGEGKAEIYYEYVKECPFPILLDYWYQDENYELNEIALAREQKTWLYKENTQIDETGKLIYYNGEVDNGDWKQYFLAPFTCIYDEKGRMTSITMEKVPALRDRLNFDNCAGQMEMDYGENGDRKSMQYSRNGSLYGSWDCSGMIEFDDKGRMIYNEHYVTHGYHYNYFLYEGDSDKPWACIYWCGYSPGFDAVYLFLE